VSVRRSVGPSVGRSVTSFFGGQKRRRRTTYAVYPALFRCVHLSSICIRGYVRCWSVRWSVRGKMVKNDIPHLCRVHLQYSTLNLSFTISLLQSFFHNIFFTIFLSRSFLHNLFSQYFFHNPYFNLVKISDASLSVRWLVFLCNHIFTKIYKQTPFQDRRQ